MNILARGLSLIPASGLLSGESSLSALPSSSCSAGADFAGVPPAFGFAGAGFEPVPASAGCVLSGVGSLVRPVGATVPSFLPFAVSVPGSGAVPSGRGAGSRLLLPEVKIRVALLQVDRELDGVQDFDVIAPLDRGFLESSRAVAFRAAGEDA